MSKSGRSDPGFLGGYNHYDDHGKKIGRSEPGLFGGVTHYNAHGHKIGRSEPGLFGGYIHYDASGHKTGRSDPGLFGSYSHYDAKGKKTGSSDPGLFGGYDNYSSSGGCYIATCVYGSYDCPEVWTLRRFRDDILAAHLLGRAFIRCYYAVSPTVVKLVGNTSCFQLFWRGRLDKLVNRLKKDGFLDTPYQDKKW